MTKRYDVPTTIARVGMVLEAARAANNHTQAQRCRRALRRLGAEA